ncbi:MAG: PilZ domain-containing protein [Acidobacteria bacterium]|nr:PilZ domain-containing protein [Acidobacteriota bacterium]
MLLEGARLTTLSRSFEDVPVRASVRFPLQLEISIRTPERQYDAVTEDVSANGVLFVSEEVPDVGTRVEFELKMPAAIMGSAEDVLLRCVGRIVRHQVKDGTKMAAAVIDEYSLKAEQL